MMDYEGGALAIVGEVIGDAQLRKHPETLVAVLSAAREEAVGSENDKDDRRLASAAARALESGRFAGSRLGKVRVALVEQAMLAPGEETRDQLIAMLRTDRDWRVRRAVLAGLVARDGEDLRRAALMAIEDPHQVIRSLGLTILVAGECAEEKAEEYLARIAHTPKISTCNEILRSEGIPQDTALEGPEAIREVVGKKGG
jgi:hypothetical protein